MSDIRHTPGSGFDWELAEDLTDLPEPELRRLLARIVEEEWAAAYRREVSRGGADLIRAELAGRSVAGLSSGELARVLLDEAGEGGTE